MANYYTDKPELRFHLNNELMRKIVSLREGDFSEAAEYPYAPLDYDDAVDNLSAYEVLTEQADAAALEKQYDAALPYFENHLLNTETHNRALKKCMENQNIPKNRKLHLRELMI